jgi:hypothetical protein
MSYAKLQCISKHLIKFNIIFVIIHTGYLHTSGFLRMMEQLCFMVAIVPSYPDQFIRHMYVHLFMALEAGSSRRKIGDDDSGVTPHSSCQ